MMHRLDLRYIPIKSNLVLIKEAILKEYGAQYVPEPRKKLLKMKKWIDDIDILLNKIEILESIKIPQIEKNLGFKFANNEILVQALIDKTIINILNEIKEVFPIKK